MYHVLYKKSDVYAVTTIGQSMIASFVDICRERNWLILNITSAGDGVNIVDALYGGVL